MADSDSKIAQIDKLLGKFYEKKGRKDYYEDEDTGLFATWFVS